MNNDRKRFKKGKVQRTKEKFERNLSSITILEYQYVVNFPSDNLFSFLF